VAEENNESVRIAYEAAVIRTRRLSNTSVEPFRYTNLFGLILRDSVILES
jgi:hypothetical protein